MVRVLTFFLLYVGALYANKESARTLHVATWPAHAEVFVEAPPTPGHAAQWTTPYALAIPQDSDWVRIYLFKPGYADTTLDVSIPQNQHSYLMVHLQPETDPSALDQQTEFLQIRTRHLWGFRLLWSSALPALLAAGFAGVAEYHYQEADTYASQIEGSVFTDGENTRHAQQQFSKSVSNGNESITRAKWALAGSALLLTTGFFLTF